LGRGCRAGEASARGGDGLSPCLLRNECDPLAESQVAIGNRPAPAVRRLSGHEHKYDDVRCAQFGLWRGARRAHPPQWGCNRRATTPQAKLGATLRAAVLFRPDFVARSSQIHFGICSSLAPRLAEKSLAANVIIFMFMTTKLTAVDPNFNGRKWYCPPTFRESVDVAVSAANLQVAAAQATDPQVLLGLALLAPTEGSIRRNLSELAVKARPDYDPILAVVAITMDGPDEMSAGELIQRDPENALGYYLQGNLLHGADRETDALESFRKAAMCPELRFYDPVTGEAIFKALDALNLHGRDRLCALTWMARRSSEFGSALQCSIF